MHSPAFALLGWALALLVFTGCIVADPPQYEEPKRTPPILGLSRAEPSPFWLVIIDRESNVQGNDQLLVTVPVRSDDQGERIWYSLYVDYKAQRPILLAGNQFEPPSTMDDENRFLEAKLSIGAQVPAGCHQLTLVAAHESSWESTTYQPSLDAPKEDIAIATWWMNVDPENSDPYTLPSCPNQSEVDK
jgi:hypothetical protein